MESVKRCCAFRDTLRWGGFSLMSLGMAALFCVAPALFVCAIAGTEDAAACIWAVVGVAFVGLVGGMAVWALSAAPRAIGRGRNCPSCIADGTPHAHIPWLGRTLGRSDPDKSGIRARITVPHEPATTEESK